MNKTIETTSPKSNTAETWMKAVVLELFLIIALILFWFLIDNSKTFLHNDGLLEFMAGIIAGMWLLLGISVVGLIGALINNWRS